jgi:NAD(P)-dependent dehydrogenase (short-subunit alcohol dehydrogenase family)
VPRELARRVGDSRCGELRSSLAQVPETKTIDVVFGLHAKAIGIPREQFLAIVEGMTHRKRSSTVAEVANAAVFLASDQASGMTGTVANLTGGMIVD